jgi:hypothetical protein
VLLGDGTTALVSEPVRPPIGLQILTVAFVLGAVAIVFQKSLRR